MTTPSQQTEIKKENIKSLSQLKSLAIQLIKHGIASVNPRQLVPQFVQMKENALIFGKHNNGVLEDPINSKVIPLSAEKETEILVLGMGKATAEMLYGLLTSLSLYPPPPPSGFSSRSNIRLRGIINVPHGQQCPEVVRTPYVDVVIHRAGHPVPDESTLLGTQKQLELAKQSALRWHEMHRTDIRPVIVLVSGGGSALFEAPVPGLLSTPHTPHHSSPLHSLIKKSITVKCQIIGLWLLSFENSFLNTDNSICYKSFQNDYTQLIALFDIFLTSIDCCCVMHNTIEKREPKADYLALYGTFTFSLQFCICCCCECCCCFVLSLSLTSFWRVHNLDDEKESHCKICRERLLFF
jgi:hypothetical protein